MARPRSVSNFLLPIYPCISLYYLTQILIAWEVKEKGLEFIFLFAHLTQISRMQEIKEKRLLFFSHSSIYLLYFDMVVLLNTSVSCI